MIFGLISFKKFLFFILIMSLFGVLVNVSHTLFVAQKLPQAQLFQCDLKGEKVVVKNERSLLLLKRFYFDTIAFDNSYDWQLKNFNQDKIHLDSCFIVGVFNKVCKNGGIKVSISIEDEIRYVYTFNDFIVPLVQE